MGYVMTRKQISVLLPVICLVFWAIPSKSADDQSGQVLGGSVDAPIRIEVYSDFQCSYCRQLYLETIKPMLQEYASKDKVCVIYHEFPLAMHQYSREAARYSEAAAQLGQQKLLPVYDSLFTDQAKWAKDGSLEATVSKALPAEDFQKLQKLLQDSSNNAPIEKEIKLGLERKIDSTPTLFISYIGRQEKVQGYVTYPVMKQFLDTIVK